MSRTEDRRTTEAVARVMAGHLTPTEASRLYGIHRVTINRALKRALLAEIPKTQA